MGESLSAVQFEKFFQDLKTFVDSDAETLRHGRAIMALLFFILVFQILLAVRSPGQSRELTLFF
jgi:hypothetical protein